LIAFLLLLKVMGLAVQLDDDPSLVADHVDDVISHRRLATKSESVNAMRFQVPPQQGFCAGHRPPEAPGVAAMFFADP